MDHDNKHRGLELESPLNLEPVGSSAFWATKSKTEVWKVYYTLDVNIQCNNHFSYLKNEKPLKSVNISEIARKNVYRDGLLWIVQISIFFLKIIIFF